MKRLHPTIVVVLTASACLTTTGLCAAESKHLVPAEKNLSSQFNRSLHERGERIVYRGKELDTIGMPVGGIAAGQLYLRGDGTLAAWQIFNKHIFTGYGLDCYRAYKPASPVESGFAVVVDDDDKLITKRLDETFGQVEFAGEYPIGLVRYRDEDFPVEIEMEAFSPFIPLNAGDSALPATLFHITTRNRTNRAIEARLVAYLENAVCLHSANSIHALRRSRIVSRKDRTAIVHTIEKAPPPKGDAKPRPKLVLADFEGPDYGDWKITGTAFGSGPAGGTLPEQQAVSGFLGKGLVNTYLGKDGPQGTLTSPPFAISRKFVNFLIGGGNYAGQTCINLLIDDEVVRTAVGKNNEKLEWFFWNVRDLEGKTAQIQIVDRHSGGWGHINIDQIEQADTPQAGPIGPIDKLPDYGSMALTYAGPAASEKQANGLLDKTGHWAQQLNTRQNIAYPADQKTGTALVTLPIELGPNEKITQTFVLTWFFPNHQNGREYANRFDGATAVADYVLNNHDRLAGETRRWHETFYEDGTLPRWLLYRLHSTVANLATGTCQWWGNNRFWGWEGVGCCAGTCTHVWNYAHAPARLFPSLERSVRQMQDFGEGFDSNSGLVGFRSNRAYAADGQCGTVLKAYREHLMSPDDRFLKKNWSRIRQALSFSIGRDGNDDGLIEDSQHNTFDINFEGANTFVGSLYLAALRAGEEMATRVGEVKFAQRCRKIFESGRRLTVEKLWDGEYFIQDVDLTKHPRHQYNGGCLSDQLFGQGWAHQLALGYIYPVEHVTKALRSIYKYNWAPDVGPYNAAHAPERWFARPGEAGLFTCTWPKSEYLAAGVRYRSEVWTGIEYQVAGHMAWEGMVDEALTICRGIEERYDAAKHNPFNEVECGDHYARAFASWGVYTGLCGFEYDGPAGHLGFAPRMQKDDFRAAFTTAEGWGSFSQKRKPREQINTIEMRWGKARLDTLALAVPPDWQGVFVEVELDGERIMGDLELKEGGRLLLRSAETVTIRAGQTLTVTLDPQP